MAEILESFCQVGQARACGAEVGCVDLGQITQALYDVGGQYRRNM